MNSTKCTRILVTGDLHQWIPKWESLVKVVGTEQPRFVLIAGDLLPKTGGFAAQRNFFSELNRYCREMKRRDPVTVLTYLGNDDFHVLEPLLDQLEAEGLCINLNGRIHREAGLVFCGMNKVRDYPFGYKHWCVPDGTFLACPQQFCGEGLTVNENGEFVPLNNLVAHLSAKPSIKQELDRLKKELAEGEMQRSVWMMHQPPSGLGMDICGNGQRVGSPTVLKFAADNQPLLGCSGHIHVLDPEPRTRGGDLEMFERWVHDLEEPQPMRRRIAFLEIEARLLRFALVVPVETPTGRSRKAEQVMIETGGLNRAEQMACFIAQHYTEPLTAEQISQSVGLHPNYAMALFKKTLGITLIDCVTQHRVSHAQRLLATTDEKIIEVALSSGFASLSRFHDAFKKTCGCSPKEYRRKHRVGFD